MGKKLTLNDFVQRANIIHNFKYDYSKVNYVNSVIKVCIICPEHGEFYQKPNAHLNGQGCKQCGYKIVSNKLKKSQDQFIEEAKTRHKDIDYHKVVYIDDRTPVCLICHKKDKNGIEHGEFWQTPDNHLRGRKGKGQTCPKCMEEKRGDNRRMAVEDFIARSNKIHNGKYSYELVDYINCNTPVKIICPTHGVFTQKPSLHLNGCGCQFCNSSHGETIISKWLTTNGIDFEEQKTFEWLKNKRNLHIDFYIKSINVGIEYQGELHYTQRRDKNKDKSLNKLYKTQFLDRLKLKLCAEHGVKIEYIKYDENIESKLNEIIKKYNIYK